MQLTDDDKDKVKQWLTQKCGQLRCTCCGLANFTLLDEVTLPIGFDVHTTRFYYAQGTPQITIMCTACGYLLRFSSVALGFRPDEPAAASSTDDSNSGPS